MAKPLNYFLSSDCNQGVCARVCVYPRVSASEREREMAGGGDNEVAGIYKAEI